MLSKVNLYRGVAVSFLLASLFLRLESQQNPSTGVLVGNVTLFILGGVAFYLSMERARTQFRWQIGKDPKALKWYLRQRIWFRCSVAGIAVGLIAYLPIFFHLFQDRGTARAFLFGGLLLSNLSALSALAAASAILSRFAKFLYWQNRTDG